MRIKTHSLFAGIGFFVSFFLFAASSFSQTKINDGTVGGSSLPNSSAILELESNDKGLLLSRVSLTTTTTWGLAGATPIAGMLVYNTNASITSSTTSYPIISGGIGCYVWDGTGWMAIRMDIPKAIADTTYWTVKGNASTNSGTNFLGTTDNHPLLIKINNTKAGYIDSSGGNGSVTFGLSAIQNNLTGTYTGVDNTAIGNYAMQNITTGSWNTAIGKQALLSVTTGGTNTAVGQFALGSNVWGWNNTAIGQNALANNNANSNTAIGQAAMNGNTSGQNNIGIGASALGTNTTGSNNTVIGQDAMSVATVAGNYNVAIGPSALRNNTASNNVAIGQNALLATTSGGNNTVIGHQGLTNNTTGTDNTIIGASAGGNLITGNNNILIGSSVAATSTSASNTINIGNTVYGINTNAATRKVGVNQSAPNSTLQVTGSLSLPVSRTTNTSVTLDDTYFTLIIKNASTATITLPAANTCSGRIYVIVHQSATTCNITSYQNLSDAATTTVASNSSITIQSDGTNWYQIR